MLERPRSGRYIREVDPDKPVIMETEEKPDGTVEFSGYLLRWGDVAEIRDFLGEYKESFEPGSMAKSFRERGPGGNNAIKVLRNHDQKEAQAGKFLDLHEDATGAAFTARTILTEPSGKNLTVEIREGVMNNMSIGFSVPKGGDAYDKERNLFTVREAMVWEASPVLWPAYQSGTIDSFRSMDEMVAALDRFMRMLESGNPSDHQIGQLTQLRSRITQLLDGPDNDPPSEAGSEQETIKEAPVNDHAIVKTRLRLAEAVAHSMEGRFAVNSDQRTQEGIA